LPMQCVDAASHKYLEAYRRYNYTTPKSYLELIALYKALLAQKRAELSAAKERLANGVEKIAQASAQVADLQIALHEEQVCTCAARPSGACQGRGPGEASGSRCAVHRGNSCAFASVS
jgi:hypothetical protein